MAATADVLAQKLDETHAEIAHVRAQVVAALRALYAGGGGSSEGRGAGVTLDDALRLAAKWTPAAGDGSSELQARVQALSDALVGAVEQLQLGGAAPQARLVHSFTHRERLKRQMAQASAMISLVDKLTHVDRLLGDIDALLDERQLVGAARAVVEAQRLLAALVAEEAAARGGDNQDHTAAQDDNITRLIELQLLRKKSRLVRQLKQIFATAIVWKDGALRVSKARSDAAGGVLSAGGSLPPGADEPLGDFWKACEVTGELPERLKDLAKAVVQHLIKPALRGASASTRVSRDAGSASLKLVRAGDGGSAASPSPAKSEVAQVAAKCSSVVSILYFLHAEVFASDPELMGRLGAFLWKIPGNLEAQLMTLLQEKIPQDAAALSSYRDAVIVGVRELEDKLLAIGFSACVDSQLRSFVQQLQELYAKKRRQSVLSQGRDMMRRGYNDSVKITGATERCNLEASVGSGKKDKGGAGAAAAAVSMAGGVDDVESGAFQVPNYRVSTCAHDVVELAHQTLIEGCTSEPKCASLLFQTSRDLLVLFRAVVPTLYESDIANDPRACMLFHNDCLYASYHMLTVGHLYKHRLPVPLNRTGTMIDMVPAFREAGEKALVAYARAQTDELALGLAVLPAFGDADADAAASRIEDFVKSALYKLNRISSFWREGLPPTVYRKITGLMVTPLASSFVERVIAAPKISASASAQLHHLASLVLECEHLFDSPGQADKHVPSLAKLRRLPLLLSEPLAGVREQFHAGNLNAFRNAELAQLVRSLHRESHEKRELLSLLQ
ncbi:hypothetical protein PybrP1_002453 [[Pythium] brassicae (nom. inval.)]|nr:hypothetical protein PybrP1_002453 [[Pythium] brassicae (nom. inval.)]